MQTLDQNLTDLVRRNVISPAKRAARPRSPKTSPAEDRAPSAMEHPVTDSPGAVREPQGAAAGRALESGLLFTTAFADLGAGCHADDALERAQRGAGRPNPWPPSAARS